MIIKSRPLLRGATVTLVVCCAALTLAACGPGGASGAGAPASSAPTAAPSGGAAGSNGAGRRGFGPGGLGAGAGGPGTYGLVAEVDGSTAQVQGANGQTAVSWTSSTRFTAIQTGTRADITVGSCVTVRAGTASPAPGSAPSAEASATAGPVTAATVAIRPAVQKSCSLRRARVTPSGAASAGPGRPSGLPSGRAPGAGRPSGGASGRAFAPPTQGMVTAVTGAGFIVRAVAFGSQAARSVSVHTTAATTYTTQRSAGKSAVKVGRCLEAVGTADSTGAVTATSITITPSSNNTCSTGRGGFSASGTNGGR